MSNPPAPSTVALPGLLPPGATAMIQTPQEFAQFTAAAVKACWDPDLAAGHRTGKADAYLSADPRPRDLSLGRMPAQ